MTKARTICTAVCMSISFTAPYLGSVQITIPVSLTQHFMGVNVISVPRCRVSARTRCPGWSLLVSITGSKPDLACDSSSRAEGTQVCMPITREMRIRGRQRGSRPRRSAVTVGIVHLNVLD
jgi:hypothetical protein